MKIVVPIKQVPETSNVKMDPVTGTMIRDGVQSVVNPLDLYAIESANILRDQVGGAITALSMGPKKAEIALREALSMGCDEAILLSDKLFAGADTWATSYALAMAIRKIGGYDVILCGERATDGDTGQVGPGIAAWLDLPVVSYVSKIIKVESDKLILERFVEEGYEELEVTLPCVLTVVKEVADPRLPTLALKKKARRAELIVWDSKQIEADPKNLGIKGSPTKVVKIENAKVMRNGKILHPKTPAEIDKAVESILALMAEKGVL